MQDLSLFPKSELTRYLFTRTLGLMKSPLLFWEPDWYTKKLSWSSCALRSYNKEELALLPFLKWKLVISILTRLRCKHIVNLDLFFNIIIIIFICIYVSGVPKCTNGSFVAVCNTFYSKNMASVERQYVWMGDWLNGAAWPWACIAGRRDWERPQLHGFCAHAQRLRETHLRCRQHLK